jgi:hypothetical protein
MPGEYNGPERRENCACVNKDEITLLFLERDQSIAFRGQAKIAGLVALAILGASFMFTSMHIASASKMIPAVVKVESDKIADLKLTNIDEHNKLHRLVNENTGKLSTMRGDIRVMDDRYMRVLSDLGELKGQLTQLVKMLSQHQDNEQRKTTGGRNG